MLLSWSLYLPLYWWQQSFTHAETSERYLSRIERSRTERIWVIVIEVNSR